MALFPFGCSSKDEAEERAKEVMFLFIKIAQDSNFEVYTDTLHTHKYLQAVSFAEADASISAIDLRQYFQDCGAALPEHIYFGNVDAISTMNGLFTEENLQALKDFAICKLVAEYGEFLPDSYSSLRSKYFPKVLSVKEESALEYVQKNCSNAISELYADRYMSQDIIDQAMNLCEEMRTSYHDLIQNADWLSQTARNLLCQKLESMIFMIGGKKSDAPDPAKDFVGKDLLATKINLARARVSEARANINQPYDRENFGMPASMVNACYDTPNTITIPYGILTAPFFDPNASKATNLGGIGAVIAHEMSHAFDSSCIDFDMNGNYRPDWIPEADVAAFQKKMDEVTEYFNRCTIMDVYHVDGELTLGENFADLGGFECVLQIVKTDGEKKELMESYANTWCSLTERKYAIMLLHKDEHSPDSVRTNAVLSSCDDFYRLYGVQEGDGMYIPPEQRVSRW